ncbi:DUF1707 domain-containing protein [Streptomyces sp. NPDC050610]|uniref:DUF1707 SHOCT-like domain-containing protein n=1 Tax=Streptomyces sp. NPDC050610 TaxID=3157097 RepID=UPI0034368ACF
MEGVEPEQSIRMRASDAERERGAEILQQAFAEGRLNMDLLQERLDALWRAATRDDLSALIRDLAPRPGPEPAPMNLSAGHNAKVRKEGRWPVPRHIRAVAEKDGRIRLDFTEADCRHREVFIEAVCVSNGPITLVVPTGWAVHTDAVAVRGNGKVINTATRPTSPSLPVIHLTGLADRGRITVSHPPHRSRRRGLRFGARPRGSAGGGAG